MPATYTCPMCDSACSEMRKIGARTVSSHLSYYTRMSIAEERTIMLFTTTCE